MATVRPAGSEPDADSPEALYLAHRPLIEEVVRFVCRRRALRGDDAEEFAAHVRLRLVESNYEMLRRFEGRSSLQTYLVVVITRLALDYQAARWGKWRASAVARAAGPAAVRLEQLVVRDGTPLDDALAIVAREFVREIDRAALEAVAARFPARSRRQFAGEELLEACAADSPDAEALLVRREEEARFARVSARVAELVAAMPPQDRLLLQMRFDQGMRVADIARTMQLDQKRLYRTIDAALASIRRVLAAEGLGGPLGRADTESAAAGRLFQRNAP